MTFLEKSGAIHRLFPHLLFLTDQMTKDEVFALLHTWPVRISTIKCQTEHCERASLCTTISVAWPFVFAANQIPNVALMISSIGKHCPLLIADLIMYKFSGRAGTTV